MAVKLMVMHPRPRDIEAFEKIYDEEHVRWPSRNWLVKPRWWESGFWVLRKEHRPFTGSRRRTSPQWRFSNRALLRKPASRQSARGFDLFRRPPDHLDG